MSFSAAIYSRLGTEYKSLVLASLDCVDDFIEMTKHGTEDARESDAEDSVCRCSRNLSEEKSCGKMAEVNDKLNNASLSEEFGTDNNYCRYDLNSKFGQFKIKFGRLRAACLA